MTRIQALFGAQYGAIDAAATRCGLTDAAFVRLAVFEAIRKLDGLDRRRARRARRQRARRALAATGQGALALIGLVLILAGLSAG